MSIRNYKVFCSSIHGRHTSPHIAILSFALNVIIIMWKTLYMTNLSADDYFSGIRDVQPISKPTKLLLL